MFIKKRELIALFLGWTAGGTAYFILPHITSNPSVVFGLILLIGFGATFVFLQIYE